MSTVVKYNNGYLVPVSNVTINHSMSSNVDGECVRPVYNIDINGYLIYNCGSPTTSGTYGLYTAEECEFIDSDQRLNALLAKHCAIGHLFGEQYKELEIGTNVAGSNLTAYPRVVSLSLSDTTNPSYWQYTVSLEAPDMFCSGVSISPTGCGYDIKSFEESWDISYDESEFLSESGDNRIFRLSHQLSAVGLGVANSGGLITQPYISAKDFVNSKKGVNAVVPTTCLDGFSASLPRYNYAESHSIDTANGSYSLSENWVQCTTPYIESYSVEIQEGSDTACPTVSIQGAIKGLEVRVSGVVPATGSKYYNASTRWAEIESATGYLANAEEMSGYDLNPYPLNGSVGKNRYTGEITYNYTYRNGNFRFLPSAKFEHITFGSNWGEDILAELQPVGGGAILHGINYNSSGVALGHKIIKNNLVINAVYPCGTGISRKGPRFTTPYSGEIQAVIDYYNPTGEPGVQFVGVESQNENWVPFDGSYSYNITWAIQESSGC